MCLSCGSNENTRFLCRRGPYCKVRQWDRYAPQELVGAAATGVAAFLYEIAWIRMLSLVLGSTTHSFELMLSAFILGIAQLIFVYVIIKCIRGGPKATAAVWDNPQGLEWTVPSPAPHHTFSEPPEIK